MPFPFLNKKWSYVTAGNVTKFDLTEYLNHARHWVYMKVHIIQLSRLFKDHTREV